MFNGFVVLATGIFMWKPIAQLRELPIAKECTAEEPENQKGEPRHANIHRQ